MSSLGTALKATGVALLASSAIAVGGIGYGGYKLSTSVSSAIDAVKQQAEDPETKKQLNDLLANCNENLIALREKVKNLNNENLNGVMESIINVSNVISGKPLPDGQKPGLFIRCLSALANWGRS